MSKGISTRTRTEHDDEHDGYVLVDPRNVILGLPEEVDSRRRTPAAARGNSAEIRVGTTGPHIATGTSLTGPRRQAIADASSSTSVWQRLARRVHHVWSGTRGKPRES